MPETLLSLFPAPNDLLALEPEELGGAVMECARTAMQRQMFAIDDLTAPLFPHVGGYPHNVREPVMLALAASCSWLVTQGLIVRDPQQPGPFYRLTKRGEGYQSRAGIEQYRK